MSANPPRVKPRAVPDAPKPFRALDVFVIILCLAVAAKCVHLFYVNLFQTLSSTQDPIGTVTIKYNTLQRRQGDRVLWDRLHNNSPVYPGDLIRVAELSGAVLHFDGNKLELDENTLIRINMSGGKPQIELTSGTINLDTGPDGGNISLVIGGKTVEATAGTVLSVASADDGMALRVTEGSATLTENGQVREAQAGTVIAVASDGTELAIPSVLMLHPRSNARFVKTGEASLPMAFSWNRINLEYGENVLLEISTDRSFTQKLASISAFDTAETSLDAGIWNWRVVYRDEVLSNGRLYITEAAGPSLISPANNSLFTYKDEQPSVRFRWTETDDVSHYILQISSSPNFNNLHIESEVYDTSIVTTDLGSGLWYWRVNSVFPSNYEGDSAFSVVASFRIEHDATASDAPDVPLMPLAKAENLMPANGYRIGPAELRSMSSITFNWSIVNGANAYIFTIYQLTNAGRQEVLTTNPQTSASYTLTDIGILDRGTFIWQVEAVYVNNNVIQRRGEAAENNFILDIPVPSAVRPGEAGVLYGN